VSLERDDGSSFEVEVIVTPPYDPFVRSDDMLYRKEVRFVPMNKSDGLENIETYEKVIIPGKLVCSICQAKEETHFAQCDWLEGSALFVRPLEPDAREDIAYLKVRDKDNFHSL